MASSASKEVVHSPESARESTRHSRAYHQHCYTTQGEDKIKHRSKVANLRASRSQLVRRGRILPDNTSVRTRGLAEVRSSGNFLNETNGKHCGARHTTKKDPEETHEHWKNPTSSGAHRRRSKHGRGPLGTREIAIDTMRHAPRPCEANQIASLTTLEQNLNALKASPCLCGRFQ